MDEAHLQLLGSALLSREVFAPVTQSGSATASDSKLDVVWEFLQTDPPSLSHLQPREGKRDWLAEMKERIFGSLREGLAITRYHLDRAELIEDRIKAIAKEHEAALLPKSGMTIGISSRPRPLAPERFGLAVCRISPTNAV